MITREEYNKVYIRSMVPIHFCHGEKELACLLIISKIDETEKACVHVSENNIVWWGDRGYFEPWIVEYLVNHHMQPKNITVYADYAGIRGAVRVQHAHLANHSMREPGFI